MKTNFDFGAVASTFKLNTRALDQSLMATKVGMSALGTHMQIGLHADAVLTSAWREKVREVFTSMQAVANRSVQYTETQVSAYLQFCCVMDAALAEAKRDLTMIQFYDQYAENALADYFGPGYAQVYTAAQQQGTGPWFRWNSVANRLAGEFPHPHIALFEQWAYLLGTVFRDDDKHRWNYIYFHYFNKSLTEDVPTFDQALTAAEAMLQQWDASVMLNIGLSASNVADIRGDLLNAYGTATNRDYGVVLDFHTKPEPIYDVDVLNNLNNMHLSPRFFASAYQQYELAAEFEAASAAQEVVNITNQASSTIPALVPHGFNFVYSADSGTAPAPLVNGIQAAQMIPSYPVRLTGPAFDGASALHQYFFIEEPFAQLNQGESGGYQAIITPQNTFGFVFGKVWQNTDSPLTHGTYIRAFLIPSFITATDARAPLSFRNTLRAFDNTDAGNVLWYTYRAPGGAAADLNVSYLSEPVDEWAVISRDTLLTYRTGCARGLFDVGTTYARSANTRKRITENNASRVESADRGAMRGGRGNGKAQSKASWRDLKR